jgi:hypothetical protein
LNLALDQLRQTAVNVVAYPMIAVEIWSRLLIGFLNGCMCYFIAEQLSDFVNSPSDYRRTI